MSTIIRGWIVIAAFSSLPLATVCAQVPGGVAQQTRGAAQAAVQNQIQQQVQAQVQGQVQQQVQAQLQQQMQQQIQARLQQQAGAQAQARMQADMNRAAELAHRAVARGRLRAAGASKIQSVNSGRPPVAGVPNGAAIDGSAQIHMNGQAEAAGNSIQLSANGHPSTHAAANLPAGMTQADMTLYDGIFGRFNPFREGNPHGSAHQDTKMNQNGSSSATFDERGRRRNQSTNFGQQVKMVAFAQADLATRIETAIHQRRSQISRLRDQALESGDYQKMQVAEQMEIKLNTFVKFHEEARARADAAVGGNANAQPGQLDAHASGSAKANASVGGRQK